MYITADVGLNTNGDLDRALEFIKQCREIGFSCVKFQAYLPDELYREDPDTVEVLRKGQFQMIWLPRIRKACDEHAIDLAITPFHPSLVLEIAQFVDWIKIGSYEIAYKDLLTEVGRTGKKVAISTGMAKTYNEISNAIDYIGKDNLEVLMYCVSKYPSTEKDIDFGYIEDLHNSFRCKIGYSDHSQTPAMLYGACMAGVTHLEMHVDLNDGKGIESKTGHVYTIGDAEHALDTIRTMGRCYSYAEYAPDYSLRTDTDGKRPTISDKS